MYLKHEKDEEQIAKLSQFYHFKIKTKTKAFPVPVIELLDISTAHN